ncbi:SusC/RagA family TonB-linked outer membrane protein [Parapedobacter defluvii]|uniref:SusC/RagA family TonB-linked outer membrane protein n=1 Tax=Parapedobacter defluvii TaxID=2045106 RepID=A0ABQ1LBI3_9SPHI|nr:SusC/RagA family TonB-linked outer membrane protein [Parapedobacter defluvii]GGC21685.1 SusC/RagA family TonB-linked outer membrane protein [Parapedobacter defluvii]
MRNTIILLGCALLFLTYPTFAIHHFQEGGTNNQPVDTAGTTVPQDSLVNDTTLVKELTISRVDSIFTDVNVRSMSTAPDEIARFPAVSLQQYLKDQAAGLYVQENTGEPGSVQQMYIRGLPMPILSHKEIYQSQPLVVVDGIPLIGEHPFAFDIQQYQFSRIGPATNLLSNIDMNNIASVTVLKDLASIALYGPMGANGVIAITTKQPTTQRKISFNVYAGVAQRPTVTTINGAYENAFRKQFYDRYTATGRYSADDSYPLYLSDSLNTSYYGPSNWTDSYYQTGLLYSANADISGGSDRANFRFAAGHLRNQGVADETGLKRYSALFNINMKPMKWLLFSAMISGNRVQRDRNRSLRDRFATASYIPDPSSPLSPNDEIYRQYLTQFDNSFDNNATNIVEGHAKLVFDFNRVKIASRVAVDYNEGYRDLFYPRTLMEENSFASNYYGYNQRLIFDNHVTYDVNIGGKHTLFVEGGGVLQWDAFKYNYAYAYKGINDFIKINLLESDPNNGNYLNPTAFPRELVFKFLDYTKQNIVSFYGRGSYNFDNRYTVSLLLRSDASSNAQPTSRWLFTPVLSLGWNIRNDLLTESSVFSTFNLRASGGRMGRLNAFDNFSQGPSYSTQVGYTGNLITPGYNGMGVLTRPYDFGWSGYGIPWSYTDQLNIGLDLGLADERVQVNLDWYTKYDRNQLLGIPSYAEFGYRQSYEAGMEVNNTGVEMLVQIEAFRGGAGKFSWTPSLNINYNQNKLTALPGGRNELIIDNRLFRVGERVDRFWLLQNDGIFLSDAEIPTVDGQPLRYNGIPLRAGDPRWVDTNGDNTIDNNDRVLMGSIFPKVSGGFMNQFRYGKWTLDANFYFNLGRNVLNADMANRFDFINREGTVEINSVKEITFWEKHGDYNRYPIYNPWSNVIPYRAEQDLFLENGSFLKLRTLSLGYDLTELLSKRAGTIERFFIYCTGNNLFTLTPYSGRDPELVDFMGRDTGYGLPIPRTYTLGIRMNL